jgi:cystathionine beta-lyase/cystathionine gamma-synthase
LSAGDLLWLETPINPFGTHFDIESLSKQAHELGALVGVDATFAPPPLMDPFRWGADYVMHSATKYLGGHSDLLAGVIVAKDQNTQLKVTNPSFLTDDSC